METDSGGVMFMKEPGVWIQYDTYDIIGDEVDLYFKGQNVAVLKGLDFKDFTTEAYNYDDCMEEEGDCIE